ncbi:secondary thiamine-phosphate synthase enzyme YjbQ [Spongiibacter marinus]|jgi:secondary thiamine-phosphate synthase enzyme|uniref:secondary thiamine-phosphate synthase enzyme YjbQ n=1 Tax=Spongiibacter marinus TaxID=354246 RepID=UPI001960ED70|nr:secondary thiamine-phosphate synthase enzyme YjbQ [Spongiibacter marinus]MBM7422825.1 secondary thiamine-phosphate synthase enzyme [Spongiibacter marinus]
MWIQRTITLRAKARGFHLIDNEIIAQLPEISQLSVGLCQLFIQHTSASLTLNENADPTVRSDFEYFFSRCVPEGDTHYQHTDEGCDDLPAHIKASLLGSNVTIPVSEGRLALGTWQGVYLGEHRNRGGQRRIVATLFGE